MTDVDFATRVYLGAPNWARSVLVSLQALRNRRLRRGDHFHQRYRTLMQNLDLTPESLSLAQENELSSLLDETFRYSPFYRHRIAAAAADALEESGKVALSAYEILDRLPLLQKDDLRNHRSEVVNSNRASAAVTHTSGTTGSPLVIAVDSESLQWTFAEWERYYRWMGLPHGFRSARFSGRIVVPPETLQPPFWVKNLVDRQLFMSTYHMSGSNLAAYVEELNRHRPQLIDGYPSALHVLASYINESGHRLDFRPTAISTTAETLHLYQREDIEKAFGCHVYNQYASSEGAPWIVECKQGGTHLWTDTGVFEFLEQEGPADELHVADLVVTSFRAKKTPLIRYNIGDRVLLNHAQDPCECGSAFPTIKGVLGRDEALVFTRNRGPVGRLDTAFKGLTGILRSKIIQVDLDNIDVLVVATPEFDKRIEDQLKANLRDRLGLVTITVTVVDSIPLGANGKFSAVESRMSLAAAKNAAG